MLKQQSEITEKEKKLKQENMILRELTGLIVKETKTNNEGVQYVYNLSGRNGCRLELIKENIGMIHFVVAFDFSLFIPNQESKQVSYSPMLQAQHNTAILSRLPDFLRSDIEFDRRQLNRFFWRLSSVLYEESNDKM